MFKTSVATTGPYLPSVPSVPILVNNAVSPGFVVPDLEALEEVVDAVNFIQKGMDPLNGELLRILHDFVSLVRQHVLQVLSLQLWN